MKTQIACLLQEQLAVARKSLAKISKDGLERLRRDIDAELKYRKYRR